MESNPKIRIYQSFNFELFLLKLFEIPLHTQKFCPHMKIHLKLIHYDFLHWSSGADWLLSEFTEKNNIVVQYCFHHF